MGCLARTFRTRRVVAIANVHAAMNSATLCARLDAPNFLSLPDPTPDIRTNASYLLHTFPARQTLAHGRSAHRRPAHACRLRRQRRPAYGCHSGRCRPACDLDADRTSALTDRNTYGAAHRHAYAHPHRYADPDGDRYARTLANFDRNRHALAVADRYAGAHSPAHKTTSAHSNAAAGAANPCAGLPCKFHVRSGPAFAANGGSELKLQFFFMHSGIDGGQPQGSYRVAMFKDGVELPMSKCAPSLALAKSSGPLATTTSNASSTCRSCPATMSPATTAFTYSMATATAIAAMLPLACPDQGQVWIVFD